MNHQKGLSNSRNLLIIFDSQNSVEINGSLTRRTKFRSTEQHARQKTDLQDSKLVPTNLEGHLMRLVTIPEGEPGAKVVPKVGDSLDSLDQLSINGFLVILLEVRQILGCLQINREETRVTIRTR